MAGFSIWHLLLLILPIPLGLAGFLPLLIKPAGPNRFGAPAPVVDFSTAVARCIVKYANFNGRARRSEYWWFYLAFLLVVIVLNFVSRALGGIAVLAVLLPMLAAGARRLHDLNRSGWWLLLQLTGVGAIGLLVLLAWPSQKDDQAEVF